MIQIATRHSKIEFMIMHLWFLPNPEHKLKPSILSFPSFERINHRALQNNVELGYNSALRSSFEKTSKDGTKHKQNYERDNAYLRSRRACQLSSCLSPLTTVMGNTNQKKMEGRVCRLVIWRRKRMGGAMKDVLESRIGFCLFRLWFELASLLSGVELMNLCAIAIGGNYRVLMSISDWGYNS